MAIDTDSSTTPATTTSNTSSSSSPSTSTSKQVSHSDNLQHDPWVEHQVKVFDLDKNEVLLSDQWKDQRAVLILLRRFGCSLCHAQVAHLLTIKPQLDAMGVKIVLVGTGNRYFANKFIENVPGNGVKFPAPVFLDPEAKAYKVRDLKRVGVTHFLSWTAIKAWRNANKSHPNADLEGDGLQTGGVYVVGPGNRAPLFEFRENDVEVGALADTDAILKACAQP